MSKEAYFYCEKVQLWYLRWIGWFLGGRTIPVHSKIYWIDGDKTFICEMTSDPPNKPEEIVGRGDGYTIQIRETTGPKGDMLLDCNVDLLIQKAKEYANCDKGFLQVEERDWYYEPQGHGGPMYDKPTCNTFISWLIKKSCRRIPVKPTGAIGWDVIPKFPGKLID